MLPQLLINEKEVRGQKSVGNLATLLNATQVSSPKKKMEPSSDQITGSDFVNVIKGNLAK